MATRERIKPESRNIVDMSWDPITRIVGNLGIYTKIDFDNREVIDCKSTSSIFRGYSVFMKGKDPRDAGFITSRICGICGDNHTVCSIYAQNMAYGIRMTPLAEHIFNLGEAAEYMFDHTIFQDNLVFVDFCEQMVKETNPSVLAKAEKTEAPNADVHGYRPKPYFVDPDMELPDDLEPIPGWQPALEVETLLSSFAPKLRIWFHDGAHGWQQAGNEVPLATALGLGAEADTAGSGASNPAMTAILRELRQLKLTLEHQRASPPPPQPAPHKTVRHPDAGPCPT